jgi:hypothetical protein
MSEQFAQQQINKYEVVLSEVESPWNTIENLRGCMLNVAPCSKAKNKYINIVHLLTDHDAIDSDMSSLIKLIINKVLFVFVIPVYARSNIKASRLAVKKYLQDNSNIKQLSIDTNLDMHTLMGGSDETTDGEAESVMSTNSRGESYTYRFDSPGPSSFSGSLASSKRSRGDSIFDESFMLSRQLVDGSKSTLSTSSSSIIDTYTAVYCKPDLALRDDNSTFSSLQEPTTSRSWLTLPALEFNDSTWAGARPDDLTSKRKRENSESSSENGSALSDLTTSLEANEEVTGSDVDYNHELEQHCNLLMFFCNNGGGEKTAIV